MHVFLHTSPYLPNYYSNSAVVQLPYATDDTRVMVAAAKQALRGIYRPGYAYLKAGVGLIDISAKRHYQHDIFQRQQDESSDALVRVLDAINYRYGSGTAFVAATGTQKPWRMRQELLSPAYVCRWSELPVARC